MLQHCIKLRSFRRKNVAHNSATLVKVLIQLTIFVHSLPVFQFSSVAQSYLTLSDPVNRSMPGLPVHTNSRSLRKLMFIESVMPSSHLILCRPLLLLSPIPPSIRVFSNESPLRMRGPKIGVSASASVLPMNTQD